MLKVFFICMLFMASLSSKTLNFAYDTSTMGKFSKKDLKIATDIFLSKLLSDIDYKGNFYYYEDISQMSKDFEANKLDYVGVNPISFLDHFDRSKVEVSFTEGSYNDEDLNMVVLVNAASNVKSWKDLKKKKIILNVNDNISKMYVDYSYLKANGTLDINYLNAKTNQKAILKLFFNQADATIVRYRNYKLAVELNPQIAKKVLLFEKTGLKNIQIGMYRKNLDAHTKKMLAEQAYKVDTSVEGRQLLDIYKTEKLVKTNLADLDKIETFYKKYKELKKRELK